MAICCRREGQLAEHTQCVGPGWTELLKSLDADLKTLDPAYKVEQVKEKFGQLRVYIHSTSQMAYNRVYDYERLSGRVCEPCGAPGEHRVLPGGWLKTLCQSCLEATRQRSCRD